MAQIYSQPVHADVKVVLSIEVSEELKALLTAQGWTPPGEEPILNSEHRRILAEQAARHRNAMAKLLANREASQNTLRQRHQDELRAKARSTRAEVAEEIAKDLENPRAWRISLEKPNPWATIAREHARGNPSEIPFPPNLIAWSGPCTACSHPTVEHSQLAGGCLGTSIDSASGRCGCALDHGSR